MSFLFSFTQKTPPFSNLLVVGLRSYVFFKSVTMLPRNCTYVQLCVENKLYSKSQATVGLNFINDKTDGTQIFQLCLFKFLNFIFLIKKYTYGQSH